METLVAVPQHRNQYYSGSRNGNNSMSFTSSPSRGFSDVNCRGFEAGMGLLPSPFTGFGSPVSGSGSLSPKPIVPVGGAGGKSKSEDIAKKSKNFMKSSPIAINLKEKRGWENVSFSELWAGPTYSNSPPPSSLPMPKFDMKPKRTVSLELPAFEPDLDLPVMAKSAPTSPTREGSRSSNDFFGDLGTKTLRRILNLDIADD